MQFAKRMMLAIVAIGSMASGAIAQGGLDDAAPDGRVPQFNTREEKVAWIMHAVEEYNAQAELAPPVDRSGEVSMTGEVWRPNSGPAARTIWNVQPRGELDCSVDVALFSTDNASYNDDVTSFLLADPRIASVTVFDVRNATPAFSLTAGFDASLTWSNFSFFDENALGNLLSRLTRFGHGVVVGQFCHQVSSSALRPGGDFLANQEYCITPVAAAAVTGAASLGTVQVLGSPLMQGVVNFNGGSASWRGSGVLHPNAQSIASWNSGEVLVATRFDLQGRRVDLNFFPPSSNVSGLSWNPATSGGRLLSNALVYASGCPLVEGPGCGPALFSQSVLGGGANSSNTPWNPAFTRQCASRFSIADGGRVQKITGWGGYGVGFNNRPQAQHFAVNIYAQSGGLPGALLYSETATGVPVRSTRGERIVLDLEYPFVAAPGTVYWLSVLGDSPAGGSATVTWAWARAAGGTSATRESPSQPWVGPTSGGFAFELCGDCFCCPGDNDFDGDIDLDDLQILLFTFGTVCR